MDGPERMGSRSFVIPKSEFGASTFTESRSFSNVLMVPTTNAAGANVNHAATWFYTGRTLNERLTLLRNRYSISSKIKKSQHELQALLCLPGTVIAWDCFSLA
jgi:hypothetical protein